MRAGIPFVAAVALLAGCESPPPQEVGATAPSISFRVTDNNVAQANANASRYCQQYNMSSRLVTVQPDSGGRVATYTCGSATVTAQPAYVGSGTLSPPAVVQCADSFHQDRPGGRDYRGPAVPGCPPTY